MANRRVVYLGRPLSGFEAWKKDHREISLKMQLLEKALLNLLRNRTEEKDSPELHNDFLEALRKGVETHFRIEEQAIFPEIKKLSPETEALVKELILEHGTIRKGYRAGSETAQNSKERTDILLETAKTIETHIQKEEKYAYPLLEHMSQEQLKKITETAASLGYQV